MCIYHISIYLSILYIYIYVYMQVNESERLDPSAWPHLEAPHPLPDGVLRAVRAWTDFVAEGEGEAQLALTAGDVVHLQHEPNDDGWGYGLNLTSGKEGCRVLVVPQ
jgi:hypothetical protein